jgi:hypothetical protein
MIRRTLHDHLVRLGGKFPIVTITGPRQSGKTTLTRMCFPDHSYVSLENPAHRELAEVDPVGFLASYGDGAILDEIQRSPALFSFLQGEIDEEPSPGRFILTGSQDFALLESVSQSLAGRTAIVELLPLDLEEIRRFPDPPSELSTILWTGGYPRIFEQRLPADEWLAAYTATYLERDVRSLLGVGDLVLFQTFLRLCAGRVGQLLNLSSLASDCGVSQPTARRWLSVLEASYIVFRLPPFWANVGKRLTKTPKLYFFDTGLVSSLLGIERPEQLETHPLRGSIFENWVVSEVTKQHRHRGKRPRLFFYRERGRLEIDVVIEHGSELVLIEAKAGQTPSSSYFSAFPIFEKRIEERKDSRWTVARRLVVYAGSESQSRSAGELVPWSELPALC